MLYYLSQLGDLLQGFTVTKALNVFQYISFRALCAGLTSFLLCLLFGVILCVTWCMWRGAFLWKF